AAGGLSEGSQKSELPVPVILWASSPMHYGQAVRIGTDAAPSIAKVLLYARDRWRHGAPVPLKILDRSTRVVTAAAPTPKQAGQGSYFLTVVSRTRLGDL